MQNYPLPRSQIVLNQSALHDASKSSALPVNPLFQLQAILADTGGSEVPLVTTEDAAKEFAAILFGYMVSEMRGKSEESTLLGGGDSELFMDFFDQAIGRSFVAGAGGPFVETLVNQLTLGAQ